VDGALKGMVEPTSTALADYRVALSGLSAGTHTLRVSYENDYYSQNESDRNALLDYYVLALPDTPPLGGDPVLVRAGKISHCANSGDEATAKLLDGVPARFSPQEPTPLTPARRNSSTTATIQPWDAIMPAPSPLQANMSTEPQAPLGTLATSERRREIRPRVCARK
jgi:hypothetical protein